MMTDDNKPFVMATLSEVAYKDLEEAKETFNQWGFTKENGDYVFYVISVRDFQRLALNMADIKRYLEQQKEIILYYEKSVTEDPEIVEEDLDG